MTAPLPPPVHGAAAVSRQIKESAVINQAFDCDYINSSTSRRIDEVNSFSLSKLFRHIAIFFEILWKLISRRYDLCYLAITCHGKGFLKDAPFVLLCKLFCKRIVIHQHNKGMASDVGRWPYRWLLPLVYKDCKVILLSWYLYPDIEKIVPKENVLICPNGISITPNNREILNQGSDLSSDESKERDSIPRILFLSNLIESKGVIVLLNALKILTDKGYSFLCDIVGDKTKEIDAKRLAEEVGKRHLNGLVEYQGRKYGAEKEKAFEKSDIFVFPTYYETFGLVNLEAMAHKLPIVSTNEGGIPDVVKDGENGLICEKKDPESLANCIEKLLTDEKLRKEMGQKGYERYCQLFTSESFEARMTECLNKCIN